MFTLKKAFSSTLGQKYLMAVSGLALVLFVILHLLGNLTLLLPDSTVFNMYSTKLTDLGILLNIAEVGLLIVAVLHVLLAVRLRVLAKKARPIGYAEAHTKMGPSKWGFASRNLIVTGAVLLIFLAIHVWQFRFGPSIEEGYVTEIAGRQVRDLHLLVKEVFSNPLWVAFYVFSMLFLGFHLKHGFWSAFQSLGATHRRSSPAIYSLGIFTAILLAIGFLLLPIWIHFDLQSVFFGA